ncbi:hypothetical protein OG785_45375 [Streptomyces sp. NBC_00006]|uniref:hypothetical protein n=1 Tax=Streptomyces sp. NBC_00006 TaxID=2975619 RepID=UPI0022575D16|nr:hypothetical protein [Streptomyces sp. NBC_00006]MCX5528977.1 hypothetical protein [Streptomyces sp. NBC_00006]MCX5537791.1 hypothetical protein [Streptomyces sp. NBC_00006]
MSQPLRLEIDLNDRTPDNLVPAHLPDGVTVQPGQQVIAYEPEDQVAAPAVVRRVELGQALLDVNWNAMRDDASSRHTVGHATIGIDVAATEATEPADSIEAILCRVRAVAAELRAQVAERETGVDGRLPMDHPMALWCDTVSNIASQIEYALRTPAPARGIPCPDGPTVREAAADDRAYWTNRYDA